MIPFSDDEMKYKKECHRYVLTKNYVLSNNIDLDAELNTYGTINKSDAAEQFLDRISRIIYNYCYSFGGKLKKEHDMATKEELREIIRDALMEQVVYVLTNGDHYLSARGDAEYKRPVSEFAHNILAESGLLFAGISAVKFQPNYEAEGH